jgi:hypothetical protein
MYGGTWRPSRPFRAPLQLFDQLRIDGAHGELFVLQPIAPDQGVAGILAGNRREEPRGRLIRDGAGRGQHPAGIRAVLKKGFGIGRDGQALQSRRTTRIDRTDPDQRVIERAHDVVKHLAPAR